MKKLFIVLFFLFLFIGNVKAEAILKFNGNAAYDTTSCSSSDCVNKLYVASGKKMEFIIDGNIDTSHFNESEPISDERVQSVSVDIYVSSNVSCLVQNLKSEYYSLNGNTFTLKNNTTESSKLKGNIGKIVCTLPTTSNVIKFSGNNYIRIVMEATDIDIVSEPYVTKKSQATYKYQFGVLNENYIKSLNDKTSVTSATIDNLSTTGLDIIELDKSTVNLKVVQNSFASKNKLYLTVESEKKGKIVNKQELKNLEQTIDLPYGGLVIQIDELTEKERVLNDIFNNYNEPISDYGFDENTFSSDYPGNFVFLINRTDNRSKENSLKALIISDVTISFNPSLKNYMATVPYKISSVKIDSILTDSKSSYVSGYGNRTVDLKEGLNTVQVKVKAENENVATYTIKITREASDDSTLKSISVNGKEVKVKEGLLIYSINVDNDVLKPTINAITNDSKATVEVEKIEKLIEGNNEINITVTAANGTKSVYALNIIRESVISTNSKLSKLEVKNHQLEFDRDKLDYNVKIKSDEDKLDLAVEPESSKAKYVITGNKDLKNESVVKIKVTAEDEQTTTIYSIKIEKEKKAFNILFIIIPASLVLVGIVVVIIMKNKNHKSVINQSDYVNNDVQNNLYQNTSYDNNEKVS